MLRNTTQRQAIVHVFQDADRPLGPREVLEKAQQTVPRLGIATVYRTIKSLVERRELTPVELPGEPPRYELAGKGHHHHFHCRVCDKVYEIDGCPGNFKGLVPAGFRMERHDVVLYGLCDVCTDEAGADGGRPPGNASPGGRS